jgi:hypothetical protein
MWHIVCVHSEDQDKLFGIGDSYRNNLGYRLGDLAAHGACPKGRSAGCEPTALESGTFPERTPGTQVPGRAGCIDLQALVDGVADLPLEGWQRVSWQLPGWTFCMSASRSDAPKRPKLTALPSTEWRSRHGRFQLIFLLIVFLLSVLPLVFLLSVLPPIDTLLP